MMPGSDHEQWPFPPGTLDASDCSATPAWMSTLVSQVTTAMGHVQVTYVLLDCDLLEMRYASVLLDEDAVLDVERGEIVWQPC